MVCYKSKRTSDYETPPYSVEVAYLSSGWIWTLGRQWPGMSEVRVSPKEKTAVVRYVPVVGMLSVHTAFGNRCVTPVVELSSAGRQLRIEC